MGPGLTPPDRADAPPRAVSADLPAKRTCNLKPWGAMEFSLARSFALHSRTKFSLK